MQVTTRGVGVSRVARLAGAGLFALAGCSTANSATPSSSGDAGPTADAASEADAVSLDDAAEGAASDGDSADADVSDAVDDGAQFERETTLVFAAPDLPPQFVCFIGFAPDVDGSPSGMPVAARGPWGVPDPSDPNAAVVFGPPGPVGVPVKLTGGYPYGAIVRLGIRKRDAPFFDELAGVVFTISQVEASVFAGDSVDSTTCRDAWSARDAGSTPAFFVKPGQIQVGRSWIAGLSGCVQASTDPQCAGGSNLAATELPLDLGTPSTFAGSGDDSVAIQVADLARFPGYQNVDVYLQPMRPGPDGGASAAADGPPIPLGAPDAGLGFGQTTGSAAGVSLSSANASSTELLVAPHGLSPSCAGQAGCSVIAIPVQPFIDKYAPVTNAAWSGHQTFVLFGRPPLDAGEDPSTLLRLGVFSSSIGGG